MRMMRMMTTTMFMMMILKTAMIMIWLGTKAPRLRFLLLLNISSQAYADMLHTS